MLTNSRNCFPRVAKNLLITLVKVLVIPRIRLRSVTGILFALNARLEVDLTVCGENKEGFPCLKGKSKAP